LENELGYPPPVLRFDFRKKDGGQIGTVPGRVRVKILPNNHSNAAENRTGMTWPVRQLQGDL